MGGPGNGPGQFNSPYGLAVDVDGILYVADARNQRIQKFNADGEFLVSFGSWSDDQKPYHIAVSGDEVYVGCGRPGIGPREVFHFSYAGQ